MNDFRKDVIATRLALVSALKGEGAEVSYSPAPGEVEDYAAWFGGRMDLSGSVVGVEWTGDTAATMKCALPLLAGGAKIILVNLEKEGTGAFERMRELSVTGLCLSALSLKMLSLRLESSGQRIPVEHIVSFYDTQYPLTMEELSVLKAGCSRFREVVCLFGYMAEGMPACYKVYDASTTESGLRVIGRSVFSKRNFILDGRLRPVPPDVVGHLFVKAGNESSEGGADERLSQVVFAGEPFMLRKTGFKARYDKDKFIELINVDANELIINGEAYTLDMLEKMITNAVHCIDEGIEGKLIRKKTGVGEQLIYCYTGGEQDGPESQERGGLVLRAAALRKELGRIIPKALLDRIELLRMPDLPNREDGVDTALLEKVGVIPHMTQAAVEDYLSSIGGINEVVAFPKTVRRSLVGQGPGQRAAAEQKVRWERLRGDREAVMYGPPLLLPMWEQTSLIAYLLEALARYPGRGIHFVSGQGPALFQSYSELFREALVMVKGLTDIGLKRGDRVILQISDSKDFFTAFWACLAEGIVPLVMGPVSSGQGKSASAARLHHAWKLLDGPVILASDELRPLLSEIRSGYGMEDCPIISLSSVHADEPVVPEGPLPEGTAFMLLTSGSTGMPKCIPVSHHSAIAHIFGMRQHIHIGHQDVVVNILPIDHITPLLTLHVRGMIMGAEQIQVDTQAFLNDPLLWLDVIDQYKGTHTFSPNFAYKLTLDRLVEEPERRWDLSSIKYFKNGGELISQDIAWAFLERLKQFGVTENRFQPAYGMTEAAGAITTSVSFRDSMVFHLKNGTLNGDPMRTRMAVEDSISFMSVGQALPGVTIRITGNLGQVLFEGQIGMIEVKGDVVTRGYVNHEEANGAAFKGGWFRTGDYGFIKDNNLVVTGRAKDVIIINGINYNAGEFEEVARSVKGIVTDSVAACSVQDRRLGTESVALFFVSGESDMTKTGEIARQIRIKTGSYFGVNPAYVIPVSRDAFPRTESGKMNRTALLGMLESGVFDDVIKESEDQVNDPAGMGGRVFSDEQYYIFYTTNGGEPDFGGLVKKFPELRGRLRCKQLEQMPRKGGRIDYHVLYGMEDLVPVRAGLDDRSEIEIKLTVIWESILSRTGIGCGDNFFELGGNSLRAIQIVSRVYKELGATIELKDIFGNPTIEGLHRVISGSGQSVYHGLKPVKSQASYALSHAQKRLWVLDKQEGQHNAYNMPMGYYLYGAVDVGALEDAFADLIRRHEMLRTVFITEAGEPKQLVRPDEAGFRMQYKDLREREDREEVSRKMAEEAFAAPFDIEQGPLLRASLIRLEEEKYLFLFTIHHIISDGWSLRVVFNELSVFYDARVSGNEPVLPPLPIQYKDYSAWYNRLFQSPVMQGHRSYWIRKLGARQYPPALPLDKPRVASRSYEGRTRNFVMGDGLVARLKAFANGRSITPFILLQATIKVLLSNYSGQKEISIGTPIAGRGHELLEGQIGFYLNNLVLVDEVEDDVCFDGFLTRVSQTNLDAYTHHLYPYDCLVEDLPGSVSKGRNPFYDIMIIMETEGAMSGRESAGRQVFNSIRVVPYFIDYTISKLDMSFFIRLEQEGVIGIEYRTDLFSSETIERIGSDLLRLLARALEQPGLSIRDLKNSLRSKTERKEHSAFKGLVSASISEEF